MVSSPLGRLLFAQDSILAQMPDELIRITEPADLVVRPLGERCRTGREVAPGNVARLFATNRCLARARGA